MIFNLFRRKKEACARRLYRAAVEQARQPGFYLSLGVPDTPEGRFEAIALHVYLILHRTKGGGAATQALSQDLFDILFQDMDEGLREMGVGDLGISHRIKAMAEAFYGRIEAYDRGLDASEATLLEDALKRNLYRTAAPRADQAQSMTAYVQRAAAGLDEMPLETLLAGEVSFPAPESRP